MKAKFCSILLLSLCCASVAGAAQSAVSERYDFSKGIPSDFILIDNDGNTPSVDVTRYGFSVGTPWVSHYVEKEDNYVAASTSWYAASGTSDDWMILPQFTVADADAVVSWRAKADNAMFSDGYAVYISEGGGEISDFDKLKPLFTVAAEQAEWTFHSVSLADYVGKTVRVAFVNNSTDCSMLYVDDIMIGTPATVRIEHTMRPLVKPSDEIVIQGNVSTDLAEPVKGFTLGYGYGGIVRTQSFTDTVLQPGETLPISVGTGGSIPVGESRTYGIWVEAGGERYETEATVTSRYNKVVAEELTGTWCGWCIRGIVTFENMKEKYPESFIGIAVHGDDMLENEEYTSYIKTISANQGYPHSITNRNRVMTGDPSDIPTFYDNAAEGDILGYIGLETGGGNGGEYTAKSTVVLNDNYADGRYRVGYVVVENDVCVEGDPDYTQSNYYSGGENGPMGGFEDMPGYLADYHFQDVGRGTIGAPDGIEGSLPETMNVGKTYTHETEFTLPESVLNPDNVYIVALLLDSRNGNIVNADMQKLTDGQPTGITNVGLAAGPDREEVFTLDGRKVSTAGNRPGMYVRRTVKDGKATVVKFVVK